MEANRDMTETAAYINYSLKEMYPQGEIQSFTHLIMEHVYTPNLAKLGVLTL
jgi:hypothetical protein